MRNLPTLRQLQYLLALEDEGGFLKAAGSCNVTQSTLSAGIREMESLIGAPVIDRTTRRLQFTPLGRSLAREGRDILGRLEKLVYQAQKTTGPNAWPLRLGIIPTVAPYLLPRFLPPLQKKRPALQLTIREALSGALIEDLREGRIDAGLIAFPYDTKGLAALTLFEEKFLAAVPAGMFKGRKTLEMADMEDLNLLLLEDGHCLRDHALEACRFQGAGQRNEFRATSLATLVQMVGQGYGVTLLPAMAAERRFVPAGVRILPFKNAAPVRKIGLVWRPGSLREDDVKDLSRVLKTVLQ